MLSNDGSVFEAGIVIDRIQALGRAAQIWLNPEDPLRAETMQALQLSTGLSRRLIEQALVNAFEELTELALRRFVEMSGLRPTTEARRVLHILPANVFTSWVPGAVLTLLLGHRCRLKPSALEPVFAQSWKKSIERVDPDLADRIEIVAWDESRLAEMTAVVAYGRDETLAQIREKLPAHIPLIGYGHKISVAIIWKEALAGPHRSMLFDQARKDIEPFQLQGCLSPQVLYVEGGSEADWQALRSQVPVMPRVRPFERWESVREELSGLRPHLSCLGYAGPSSRFDPWREDLLRLGFSRICPLGEMQRPPLAWRNGGISLVECLGNDFGPVAQSVRAAGS